MTDQQHFTTGAIEAAQMGLHKIKQNKMKANELRIGNWALKALKSGLGRKLKAQIGPEDIVRIYNNTGSINYEPIPLDESWLIRAGFEKVIGTNLYKKTILEISGQKLKVLIVYLDGDKHTVALADYYTGLEKIDLFHMDYEFVHQLQNLFFALTGTELEFKDEPNP